MARATRKRASSPAREEQHAGAQEMDQDGSRGLQTKEALSWRAGKPIPVSELLRRLKSLHEELSELDNEDADRETLVPKAQELAGVQLLDHKDKGVRAYTMLCIAQMFALLAPDAPYKESQLKAIFTLFASTIIPALSSPSDPYYQEYLGVLTSFVEFKSIMLVLDMPGSETLLLNIFRESFDVLLDKSKAGSADRVPKNIEYHLTRLLCTLTDEAGALPTPVIDVVLAQFLRADPKTLSSKGKQEDDEQPFSNLRDFFPAYNMARSICNTSSEQMTTAIGQYFSSVLLDASDTMENGKAAGKSRKKQKRHSTGSDDDDDDRMVTPPADHDFGEMEKAHRLMRELWRASPDVIISIVPHLEAEIVTENYGIRALAVRTVGDMIAGIGAAGPPPPTALDPAAYPLESLQDTALPKNPANVLLTPAAPHAFAARHPSLYQAFIHRRGDRSAPVRAAFAAAVGHVVLTSGGGKGLDKDQETQLLRYMADMLLDTDEKVRLSAVQSLSRFGYHSIVQKLGQNGGISDQGSVLCTLGDRIKDPSHNVRVATIDLLARLWGVASGAITEGSERVRELLGAVPSRLLDSLYVNNQDINATVQRVLYEHLLPVSYPPIKSARPVESESQRGNGSQSTVPDPDMIRVERILTLVRDLDQRARRVFFALQAKQSQNAKFVEALLQASETVNEASADKSGKEAKKTLDGYINKLAIFLPDPAVAADNLRKFAKQCDRRCFHLVRICLEPGRDYRMVTKAMKELVKRASDSPTGMSTVIDETILPLLRWSGVLVYNRSHVPAIMAISNTDEKGLGGTAQEVMKEISSKAPEIFKAHVRELCKTLTAQVPSAESPNDATAVDTLKACAGFARRFPDEMPKDRDFNRAMVAFALYGTPPKAAKQAVTVIASAADKKEMYIQQIVKECIDGFEYGSSNYLTQLATISQLRLVASSEIEGKNEAIMGIAAGQVLTQVRTPPADTDPQWSDEIDDDLCAKLWALKILVNGVRGLARSLASAQGGTEDEQKALRDAATPVYRLLNTLIERDGELSKTATTPIHHKARLRLAAATELLKLSSVRSLEIMLTPTDFNRLAKVVQDPNSEVRSSFGTALRKHLGQGVLNVRFYSLAYLYAFEPAKEAKEAMVTWLKARSAFFAKRKEPIIESVFARFLSILAHHQDFSTDADELEDFVEYIMFYLKNAATEASIPPIYSIAQKMKSVQDGIDPEKSENLYVLSDLAEAVIRYYQEIQGWSIQIYGGKVRLPSGLFASLPSHAVAQEISEKRYVPDELYEKIEDLVKQSMRTKKRKAETSSTNAAKKPKTDAKIGGATQKKMPVRKASKPTKTPKKRKEAEDTVPLSERRKSSRSAKATNYAEEDDSADDAELEQQQFEEEAEGEDEEDNVDQSTPPTSDPAPGSVSPAAKKKQPSTTKEPPARRVPMSRGKKPAPKKARKEKDVMDIPSDSDDGELSDVPSDVEMEA